MVSPDGDNNIAKQGCEKDSLITIQESMAEIRKSLRLEIPAILITGDIEVARLQDVQESAIPFLHKPIQADKLRTLMHYLLSTG